MEKRRIYTIESNEPIARDVYRMVLAGDVYGLDMPGQFVNIDLDGFFLRRPISICDVSNRDFTIIYKVVGEGTRAMSMYQPGQRLDILTNLGNGFDVNKGGKKPLIVGGGVGVPPMYLLCRHLLDIGAQPQVVLGFRDSQDVILEREFRRLNVTVRITTEDGSMGMQGFVTDAMADIDYDYFYACGPVPMLRTLCNVTHTSGQLSFEERMGCGFGACMGCSCRTKYGTKRICKDGPVLEKEEIIW